MNFVICEDESDDDFFGFLKPPGLCSYYPRSAPDLQQLDEPVPVPTRQFSTSGSWTVNQSASGLGVSTRSSSEEMETIKPSTKRNIKKFSRTCTLGLPAERNNFEPERHPRGASIPDTSVYPTFSTDEDLALQRLRNFSVRSKQVINRGDSFRVMEELCPKNKELPHPTCSTPPNSPTPDKIDFRGSSGTIRHQVLVIGCSEVGKSSILCQFTTSEYICDYDSNQDECDEKLVTVILNGEESELLFVEQTISESKTDTELNLMEFNADAYVVVYSVTNRASFHKARTILNQIKSLEDVDRKAVILVGNKTDLARLRMVSTDAGRALATYQHCKFIETSAGINHHVDELLVGTLSQIRLKRSQADRPVKKRNSVSLDKMFTAASSSKSRGRMKQLFGKAYRKSKSCVNLQVI
ncbi:GTP-binding protein REM 1-like [Limulus polyphemus]|uniref:GTP-binding protein REM 1-like n=1 Tax=Limulus polyphemus TaxID=6850 RepID=A0ABM1SHR4_LIMPO|nr:GTP-binding protein REM 1-like [Limulus polyphemus]